MADKKNTWAKDQQERLASIKPKAPAPVNDEAPAEPEYVHVVPEGVTITFSPKNAPGPGAPPAPVAATVLVEGKVE